jgi:hypothetical protein
VNIQQEIAALRLMSLEDLRAKYVDLFAQLPRASHKGHLLRKVVWQAQAAVEGGLSDRARRRAAKLTKDADLPVARPRKPTADGSNLAKPPAKEAPAKRDQRLPMRGTVLVRPYRGRMIEVRVLDQGFEHNGQIYKSLTAVAQKITGKHWNGYHFFRL